MSQLRDLAQEAETVSDVRIMYEALKTGYDEMSEAFADLLAEAEVLQSEQEVDDGG